jgi:PhzF family phenazine biosynthesis protein
MSELAFQQVDVFTAVPFKGNPVAVVFDADKLSSAQMQAIANWTNLSETTFVCKPKQKQADYRLRIFTPKSELPFAGHPTIGSAHAVLRHGLTPKTAGHLVQECGKGLVSLQIDDERLFLSVPTPTFKEVASERLAGLANALGIEGRDILGNAAVDVGIIWITLQLNRADLVRSLQPDLAKLQRMTPQGVAGVTVFGLESATEPTAVEVRSFAPAHGIPEDPVCGSGNGCVAALVRRDRLLDKETYVATQGRCVGRDGRVTIRFAADGTIWLGGHAVTCMEGWLHA